MEDPITADFAARNEIEEEEESAIAFKLPDQYKIQPTIDMHSPAYTPPQKFLLLLESTSSLSESFINATHHAGSITIPLLQRVPSPLKEEYGTPAAVHTTTLHQQESTSTLLASSRVPLPPEQAFNWAEAVLKTLQPRIVVIVTPLLAMHYRGPGDPSEDDLVYLVHNSHAKDENKPQKTPLLPSGTYLSGLPAAFMELCENEGIPAICLVAIQHSPIPGAGLLYSMAEKVAESIGVDGPSKEDRHRMSEALNSVYRSSASNSMFI